jgi:CheY-like chemotaxis protein
VQSAVEAARPNLDAMQHEFSVSLPPERIELEGDASRLAQVLSNLLNNACKFTEPGGRIALAAQREGDQVAIRVRDSGIGIRPEVLPRVFDMFVQGDASVARSQGGLGLGLPLVKGLVEMHGGSVTATSGGPGQGAEFVVRLPVAPPSPEDVDRPAESAPEVQALRLKILVVDDNRDAATSLASLLKLRGHEVVAVHDGPAALDAADRFSPEVVLQDIGMPGMSGFEVARLLRQRASGRDLTLVALTGYGSDDDRRRTREAGFDSHFVKPLDLAALDDLLARREATAPAAPGR